MFRNLFNRKSNTLTETSNWRPLSLEIIRAELDSAPSIFLSLVDGVGELDVNKSKNLTKFFNHLNNWQYGLPTIDGEDLLFPIKVEDFGFVIPMDFYWESYELSKIDREECPGIEEALLEFRLILSNFATEPLPSFNILPLEISEKGAIGGKAFSLSIAAIDKLGREIEPEVEGEILLKYRSDGKQVRYFLSRNEFVLIKAMQVFNREIPTLDSKTQMLKLAEFKSMFDSFKNADRSWRVHLSNYLVNEAPQFVKEVTVGLSERADGRYDLSPLPLESDQIGDQSIFKKPVPSRGFYTNKEGTLRTRVIPSEEVNESLQTLNKHPSVGKLELMKMSQAPEELLGPGISLEDFSKRVKDIGLFVYKAQPYCDGGSGLDWWDWEFKLDLEGLGLQGQPTPVNELELDKIEVIRTLRSEIELAIENDEKFIDFQDLILDVFPPEPILDLLEAREKQILAEDDPEVKSTPPKLALIIKENIEELEFDETRDNFSEVSQKIRNVKLPALLKSNVRLKSYQEAGFYWLWDVYAGKSLQGGLLADDMGLGKTLQLICFLSKLKDQNSLGPSLCILPKSLLSNWEKEIEKFLDKPCINTYKYYGSDRSIEKVKQSELTLTTYETVRRNQIKLGKVDFKVIILDEAQAIKNANIQLTSAVKALKADVKIAVTGTPVENTLVDLWSIFDFLKPGYLGSLRRFKTEYVNPIQQSSQDDGTAQEISKRLVKAIKPHMLRRLKDRELKGELPPLIHQQPRKLAMSDLQQRYYNTLMGVKTSQNVLAVLQKMLMVCAHPFLLHETDDCPLEVCPKLDYTMSVLRDVYQKGEKAIIFIAFLKLQELVQRIIEKEFDTIVTVINGSVESSTRQGIIDIFNESDGFRVMILSPRAGGVGLNITAANHVICYTRPWNPAIENQAIDRVYRIGQELEVSVYYPVSIAQPGCGTSVEERLAELLAEKRHLIKEFVRPSDSIRITEKDFMGCLEESVPRGVVTIDEHWSLLDRQDKIDFLATLLHQEKSGQVFQLEYAESDIADLVRLGSEQLEFYRLDGFNEERPKQINELFGSKRKVYFVNLGRESFVTTGDNQKPVDRLRQNFSQDLLDLQVKIEQISLAEIQERLG